MSGKNNKSNFKNLLIKLLFNLIFYLFKKLELNALLTQRDRTQTRSAKWTTRSLARSASQARACTSCYPTTIRRKTWACSIRTRATVAWFSSCRGRSTPWPARPIRRASSQIDHRRTKTTSRSYSKRSRTTWTRTFRCVAEIFWAPGRAFDRSSAIPTSRTPSHSLEITSCMSPTTNLSQSLEVLFFSLILDKIRFSLGLIIL